MGTTGIIFRREVGAYLRSPIGYIVGAVVLFVDGLLFYSQALGAGKRLSAEVLSQFFYWSSGAVAIAAVALAMRTIAEERQNRTLVLLNTSPVRDSSIVVGKFLAALTFLTGLLALTLYMPLLILVRGKISGEQVIVGYAGLFLLGAAVLAIGVFASALTRHQLLAVLVGAAITVVLYLFWPLSEKLDAPLKGVFAALAIHARHFRGFMTGTLHLRDVVYYLAVIYFFLLMAIKTMEAKRWS